MEKAKTIGCLVILLLVVLSLCGLCFFIGNAISWVFQHGSLTAKVVTVVAVIVVAGGLIRWWWKGEEEELRFYNENYLYPAMRAFDEAERRGTWKNK